jgi:cell division protein FtsZ
MVKIKIIGVGGAGVNTVNRLKDKKLPWVGLVAVNTDTQSLDVCEKLEKIQIGTNLTKGFGTGGNIEIGRMAANESRQDIARLIEGTDLVFIVLGAGGGTGGGAGPVIAKIAKEVGAVTVAIATTPFAFEGQARMATALEGISSLENEADTVVVIPNKRLFNSSIEISLSDAFKKVDTILINAIRAIVDLIAPPGLINLDFSNIRAVLTRGGRGLFCFGEASGEERVKKVVEETFSSNLLEDAEIKNAAACLVNIYGSRKLSFKEVTSIMEDVSSKLDKATSIVFGVTIDNSLKHSLRMTVICTGIRQKPLQVNNHTDAKHWPEVFDYKDELDTPSFLRKK